MVKGVTKKSLSFLGGVIIIGAAVATLIAVSPKVRKELEYQSSQVLDTTREAITKAQGVIQKIQGIGGALSGAFGEDSEAEAAQTRAAERQAFEAQWSEKAR